MKAIILNAGKGGRLGNLTDDRPKCLVEVGGRPILDFQLDALRAAGVLDLVMVVGYRQEMIRKYLRHYPEFSVTWIENPDYAVTNTAYSLCLARHTMTDDILYCNGDVLFHPELLRRLVASPAACPMAVERKRCGEEEVKVMVDGTRIVAIGKELSPGIAFGEFIGVARFSSEIFELFRQTLEEVVIRDRLVNDYFERAIERMLGKAIFTTLDSTDLPCIEIDFPEDLERASREIVPRIGWSTDAVDIEVALAGKTALVTDCRVLFYVERDLHLPFLEPIFDWLQENSDCTLAFAVHSYRDSRENAPGFGLPQDTFARLAQKACLITDIAGFKPDVTVCADACPQLQGICRLVFVGHGIISKGAYYTSGRIVRRENMADLICVPGPLHKDLLEQQVFSKIEVTGFIKSDKMFAAGVPSVYEARSRLGLQTAGKVVLFAPTYNTEMSSLYVIGEQIAELCRDGIQLLVKLHTMTDRIWKERFRSLALKHENLFYCDDIDVTPAMLAADLLITDVSSVMAEFMFLNRPVIVVDNPHTAEYPLYIPDDIEYRVRDAATVRVVNFSELREAVLHALQYPDELAECRSQVARSLCFGRDGRSSERCGQAILSLLKQPVKQPDMRCTVVVDWPFPPSGETARRFEQQIRRANPDVSINCLHNRMSSVYAGLHGLMASAYSQQWTREVAKMVGDDYLILIQPEGEYPAGWIRRLSLYFRWNERAAVVQPLSYHQNLTAVADCFLPTEAPNLDYQLLASILFKDAWGYEGVVEQPNSQCVMIRPGFIRSLNEAATSDRLGFNCYLMQAVQQADALCIQAFDVLCWPVLERSNI